MFYGKINVLEYSQDALFESQSEYVSAVSQVQVGCSFTVAVKRLTPALVTDPLWLCFMVEIPQLTVVILQTGFVALQWGTSKYLLSVNCGFDPLLS